MGHRVFDDTEATAAHARDLGRYSKYQQSALEWEQDLDSNLDK